jgi:hypothetical protein
VEWSSDLKAWTTAGLPEVRRELLNESFGRVSVRVPLSMGNPLFLRAYSE